MLKRAKPARKTSRTKLPRGKVVIGWREWAVLPDLGISRIKVKIDTGAKTSSLHAYDVSIFKWHGKEWVKFKVHPLQRNDKKVVACESPLLEWRQVTDSGGKRTLRPVIETRLMLGAREVLAEVTLIARDEMGFRMLVGRQAIKNKWIVDPGKGFLASEDVVLVRTSERSVKVSQEEE
jgi:hypothetical protein